jgi:mannitol/fructose-specific phosphotransferase system IIA component (Ntr-type)
MRIHEILDARRVVLNLEGETKEEILRSLVEAVTSTHEGLDPVELLDALVKREDTGSTAIADGIAIPHGKLGIGEEVICAFGLSKRGLDFKSVDGKPSQLFFLLVSPENFPTRHLQWLAHIAVLLKNPDLRSSLLAASSPDDVLSIIEAEEANRDHESALSEESN